MSVGFWGVRVTCANIYRNFKSKTPLRKQMTIIVRNEMGREIVMPSPAPSRLFPTFNFQWYFCATFLNDALPRHSLSIVG